MCSVQSAPRHLVHISVSTAAYTHITVWNNFENFPDPEKFTAHLSSNFQVKERARSVIEKGRKLYNECLVSAMNPL